MLHREESAHFSHKKTLQLPGESCLHTPGWPQVNLAAYVYLRPALISFPTSSRSLIFD
jgi:hypothetical protein